MYDSLNMIAYNDIYSKVSNDIDKTRHVRAFIEKISSRNNDASSLEKEEEEEEVVVRWGAVLMVPMRLWDDLSIDF